MRFSDGIMAMRSCVSFLAMLLRSIRDHDKVNGCVAYVVFSWLLCMVFCWAVHI